MDETSRQTVARFTGIFFGVLFSLTTFLSHADFRIFHRLNEYTRTYFFNPLGIQVTGWLMFSSGDWPPKFAKIVVKDRSGGAIEILTLTKAGTDLIPSLRNSVGTFISASPGSELTRKYLSIICQRYPQAAKVDFYAATLTFRELEPYDGVPPSVPYQLRNSAEC